MVGVLKTEQWLTKMKDLLKAAQILKEEQNATQIWWRSSLKSVGDFRVHRDDL